MNELQPKVLAAVDSSAAAGPVLSTAVGLAHILGARAEAIHVVEDGSQTPFTTAERFGVPCTQLRGKPLERITECGNDAAVVAVVVGARRRLAGHHLGHLARALIDTLEKPVLVVPPESHASESLRTVVVAMEGAPQKARSVKSAIEVATDLDLDLVVVHVDDEDSIPSFSDQIAHETEVYAEEFLARYAPGAPKATLRLRVGQPADEVLKVSDEVHADMLAIGWPHVIDPVRGTVAQEILDRSHVPVLLVAVTADDD